MGRTACVGAPPRTECRQGVVVLSFARLAAAVAAGKLTSAQATDMKANVTAMVTDKVNNTRPMGMGGRGGHGRGGHGHGDNDGGGPQGGSNSGGSGQLVVPGTGTTSTAKYSSGLTIKA